MKIQTIITKWFPRVLAIIYIIFIALLSLDVLNANATAIQKIGGLIISNIPTILLLVALFLAWKKPATGGTVFLMLSILFSLFFRTYQRIDTFILISCPLLLVGVLFLLNKKKNENDNRGS